MKWQDIGVGHPQRTEAAANASSSPSNKHSQRRPATSSSARPDWPSLVAQSPRMVAQQMQISSLFGNTAQRLPTEHDEGDFHYGVSEPRYDGFDDMNKTSSAAATQNEANPVSVDYLNHLTGVTGTFNIADRTAGYFATIQKLEGFTYSSAQAGEKGHRWLDFLKRNKDYLDLAPLVNSIQSTATPTRHSKNKLTKNGPAPTGSLTETGKRDAIVLAYAAKATSAAPVDYQTLVNGWISDAFFRKTSKLGIDFTMTEGKVVHFNMDSPGNLLKGRADSTVDVAATANAAGRQPITHSELRYVNRRGLIGNPNMDVYLNATEVNSPRTPGLGAMPTYLSARGGAPVVGRT